MITSNFFKISNYAQRKVYDFHIPQIEEILRESELQAEDNRYLEIKQFKKNIIIKKLQTIDNH